ncbi:MAG TPA: thioredoxin domain-containing protein [Pyrinomonadaceae bacterium]
MKKLLSALVILLVACAASISAQTPAARRTGAANSTNQRTGTTAATPAATPATTTATAPQASATGAEDCGCEAKPVPDVLAVVNGIKITKTDISAETQQQIKQLQQQVVDARKRELDLTINSRLLEAEAKKRGVTSTKFLEQEIVSKAKPPTDAEAQAFFDQNKAQIQQAVGQQLGKAPASVAFTDVKDRLVEYLSDQRQREEAKNLADRLRAAAQVKVLIPTPTPPATPADRARVLATVNGQNITSGDIEDNLRPLIFEVQERVYQLRNRDVELKINDTLLEQEAQKRKVTTKALLDTEVATKIPTVTDVQAQTFYDQNKDRINGAFPQVKQQIIQYLQEDEERKAQTAFAEQLRRAASVQTFISAPEPPVYNIATDDQPIKGNPTATVTLVEFTDYQCPSCARVHPVLETIATEYADRLKIVVRDYPLTQHANAFKAAEAAEAAREQGKYWEYTSILFKNQSALEVAKLKEYATQLGLDRQKFDAALDSGRFADKVQRDIQDGNRVGVNGTPTLFVNGRRVNGNSYEALKTAIDAALRNSARK